MAGLLNTSSVLQCPHGGSVTAITSNSRAKAAGDFLVRSSDTFTIAGCPFMIGPSPHPCMSIQWVQPDQKSQVLGDFTLSEQSVGLCVAGDQAMQGTVLISTTQQKVSGL
jgi:hypothetical protein